MTLTLQQAKNLSYGTILYSLVSYNKKGQPHKVRVTGQTQTWKRDPNRVRVPFKHGLYVHGAITERNLSEFTLSEQYAIDQRR